MLEAHQNYKKNVKSDKSWYCYHTGFTEAGRHWSKTFEGWLLRHTKLKCVIDVIQIYVMWDKIGKILMLMTKGSDELLMARSVKPMNQLASHFKNCFDVRKGIINNTFNFNGCDVYQIRPGMWSCQWKNMSARLRLISLNAKRKKDRNARETQKKIRKFRTLAGELVWIWCSVLPQAPYALSMLQKLVPRMTVQKLIDANAMKNELKDLSEMIRFKSPSTSLRVLNFSLFLMYRLALRDLIVTGRR